MPTFALWFQDEKGRKIVCFAFFVEQVASGPWVGASSLNPTPRMIVLIVQNLFEIKSIFLDFSILSPFTSFNRFI